MITSALMILSSWLVATLFIDFVAVPALFTHVSSAYQAGQVGEIIFSTFNTLEVLFSLFVISFIFLSKKRLKSFKLLLTFGTSLLFIVSAYRFIMTPAIGRLNSERQTLEVESAEYLIIEKEHNFYHKLYVKMDSGKILLLIFVIIGLSRKRREQEVLK